jgi:hypothetical protein
MAECGNPPLLLAAETNLYPPEIFPLRDHYPSTGTRYQFVNSPFVLDLRQPINADFLDIGEQDDQVHLNKLYLKYKNFPGNVCLDYNQYIIQTLYNVGRTSFTDDLQNKETGTKPIFFHGNGKTDMTWLMNDNQVTPNKILIAVRTGEFARKAEWFSSFMALDKPIGCVVTMVHGQSPARNANIAIQQALEISASHIFFIDDDNIPADPYIISKLAAHDKDIVSGLYVLRNAPHRPCIFDSANEHGMCAHHYLKPGEKGLIPIVNCGFGSVLIKTKVFRKMLEAQPDRPLVTLGEAEKDHWCDDITFFNRARNLGFELFCDLDQIVGHHHTVVLWPNRHESGNWFTIYDSGGTHKFGIPAPTHHPADENFKGVPDIPLQEPK